MSERVIVKGARNGHVVDIYHTNADCPRLARMQAPRKRPIDELPPDVRECVYCSGEWTPNGQRGVDPHDTRNDLLETTPDQLGLSAMGERDSR